jgi:Fe2+ or Zn2+ uptake regulation protein
MFMQVISYKCATQQKLNSILSLTNKNNYIMQRQLHYATVSEALEQLRQQGFTIDFNIDGSHLIAEEQRIHHDEFEIVDVYRYEGNTDPADEATVYAIQSKQGLKGVLVTGYGASHDNASDEILRKLHGRS